MLPEQVWDEADLPGKHLYFGKATGAATPLMWAHAEYIRLLRSTSDGVVFDLLPEVADRYLPHTDCEAIEVWKPNRQVQSVERSMTLRILAPRPFLLRWTPDDWSSHLDDHATGTSVGIWYHDISPRDYTGNDIRFTFRWEDTGEWDTADYVVAVLR